MPSRIVLHVAEKNSVAKGVAAILAKPRQPRTMNSPEKYVKNYSFRAMLAGRERDHIVTAVKGHVMDQEFGDEYRQWTMQTLLEMFDADVRSFVSKDNKNVVKNLQALAKRADKLVLWLDCDREGEAIAFEVIQVCSKAQPSLQVKRARFSAVTDSEINHAMQHLVTPDKRQYDAVRARQALDFKLGVIFTRFQTLLVRRYFGHIGSEGDKSPISYGPCQFPTLGFVVERFQAARAFIPQDFWALELVLKAGGAARGGAGGRGSGGATGAVAEGGAGRRSTGGVKLLWDRQRLFDRLTVVVLGDMAEDAIREGRAEVVQRDVRARRRWKPKPLSTVEMQKLASKCLRISAKASLEAAEKLYNRGILSYPRTETEKFDPSIDLMGLVSSHSDHHAWGEFAAGLQAGGFRPPRQGERDDNAHPPIHPKKSVPLHSITAPNERAIYELVTRHFLACCADDCLFEETRYRVKCDEEHFHTKGVVVRQRNYLDVYDRYDRWRPFALPDLGQIGQTLSADQAKIEMREGHTVPPPLLTEHELLQLMDKNCIGTDATMAQHIDMVQRRKYVTKQGDGKFVPTTLGFALVQAYHDMQAPLGRPTLRRNMERECDLVAHGQREWRSVVKDCLEAMRHVFLTARTEQSRILHEVKDRLGLEAKVALPPKLPSREGDGMGVAGGAADVVEEDEDANDGDDGPGGDGDGGGGGPGGPGGPGGGMGGDAAGAAAGPVGGHYLHGSPVAPSAASKSGSGSGGFGGGSADSSAPQWGASRGGTDEGQGDGPRCKCGDAAVKRTSRSKHAGRQFWCCGKGMDEGCGFFEWVDDGDGKDEGFGGSNWGSSSSGGFQGNYGGAGGSSKAYGGVASGGSGEDRGGSWSSGARSGERATGQGRGSGGAGGDGADLQCKCGDAAVLRTSRSKHAGRQFWCCGKGMDEGCGFFEWADEAGTGGPGAQQHQSAGGGASSGWKEGSGSRSWGSGSRWDGDGSDEDEEDRAGFRGGGRRGATAMAGGSSWKSGPGASKGKSGASSGGAGDKPVRRCGICRQVGHDRRQCPQAPQDSASRKATKSGGGKGGKSKAKKTKKKKTGGTTGGFQIGTQFFEDFD